jgi:hypothetical protein
MSDDPKERDTRPMRRIDLVEQWLHETRTLAQVIDDNCGGHRSNLAAVLHQAAALVELVRDGYAVTIHIEGREIARSTVRTPR